MSPRRKGGGGRGASQKAAGPTAAETSEKLQKLLARAGRGSRREAETWIEAGRVKVNGKVATRGDRVGPRDKVELDGRPVRRPQAPNPRVLVYHKPAGEVCTRSDPEGRPTVFERLPRLRNERWVAVGRLDLNTSGLLLVTTDGELANRLMHPSSEIDREYAVRVLGEADADTLKRLCEPVELEDGPARFESVVDAGGQGANHWYHVTLREGRKREVRRLWESQGFTVSRLHRVRFGPIKLRRGLRSGRWEELRPEEVRKLFQVAGLARAEAAEPRKRSPRKGRKADRRRG